MQHWHGRSSGMADVAPDPELDDWALLQPAEVTGDPIWRLAAYRNAAYFVTLARDDAVALGRDPLRIRVGSQLLRAAGSIAANVAEGYGRPTAPDRIRYFSYALGSVRETAVWYDTSSGGLPAPTLRSRAVRRAVRLAVIRRILRGLLTRLRTRSASRFDKW